MRSLGRVGLSLTATGGMRYPQYYHRCLTSVIWTTETQQAFSPCQTSGSNISSPSHCEKTEIALCYCQSGTEQAKTSGPKDKHPFSSVRAHWQKTVAAPLLGACMGAITYRCWPYPGRKTQEHISHEVLLKPSSQASVTPKEASLLCYPPYFPPCEHPVPFLLPDLPS